MCHRLSRMNAILSLVCVFSSSLVCNASTKLTFVSSSINHDVCAFSKPSLSSRCRQHQLYSQTASQDQDQQQHSSGRRWRNKRKRQTFLPSPVRSVTSYDEDALMDQLGYVPPNACRVSARSGDTQTGGDIINVDTTPIDTSSNGIGRPIAIQSYPLLIQLSQNNKKNVYTPFPTMYWLTCPHISRAISELERIGHVRNFQLKLEGDEDLSNQWWDSNEEYANERWNLLSNEDRDWLLVTDVNDGGDTVDESEKKKRESMRKIIQFSGVAGTDHRGLREDDASGNNTFVPSVKCLHSHYGHYRSQLSKFTEQNDATTIKYNLVGKWTHELLLEKFPDIIF